jgi:four helix bundle protein
MADQKPTLCVVAGPNGSGKTTTTEQLLANEWGANSLYINPDNIAEKEFGSWNSPEAVLKAAQRATELRYQCMAERRDFVFETVFSSAEKLDFLRKAHEAGFFIRLFYVCTKSPEINVARIAKRIAMCYRHLRDNKRESVMSKQLLRSGTSIGANVREGLYAQSRKDFVSKLNIALKEAAETDYWLDVIHSVEYFTDDEFNSLKADNDELLRLLTSIIKTTKTTEE